MYRHRRVTLIAAGGAAIIGAMLLIPGGEQASVVDTASIPSVSSQETIAAIDAMLGSDRTEVEIPEVASVDSAPLVTPAAVVEPDPANFQTAALADPIPEPPAIDPSLTPDSIGASAVNLRAGPSTANATVAVLQPGQAVHTGATSGGWVEVTLDDGTTGWVYSRYLASVAATLPTAPAATAKAVVKDRGNGDLEGRTARIDAALTARARPNDDARTVFRTSPGERVKILDVRGNWLRILTADGSSGWIERAG